VKEEIARDEEKVAFMIKNNFQVRQLLNGLSGGLLVIGILLLSGRVFAGDKGWNIDSAGSWYQPAAAERLLDVDFSASKVLPPKNKSRKNVNDMLYMFLPNGEEIKTVIRYEDGNKSGRYADVVADPSGGSNQVLHFWLKKAQVGGQRKGSSKGRIQLNMSKLNFTEVYQRFRVYLGSDLIHYKSLADSNGWFTIGEFWFGQKGKHPHPFRITLGIVKNSGAGSPLLLAVSGEVAAGGKKGHGKWSSIWHEISDDAEELPVGEWIDIEIGYRQGDKETGRFEVSTKRRDDSKMFTVLSVNDWTYSPEAKSPVPLTAWNPLKIYTSSKIIDHIQSKGGVAELYFDDLEIRASKGRR